MSPLKWLLNLALLTAIGFALYTQVLVPMAQVGQTLTEAVDRR